MQKVLAKYLFFFLYLYFTDCIYERTERELFFRLFLYIIRMLLKINGGVIVLKNGFFKKYGAFTTIFIVSFLVYCSNQMVGATISKFADYMGATASLVGTVAGSFQMVALFIRPVSGQAVDNGNKKFLLSFSMFVILISTVGLLYSDSVFLLILFRGINGLGWGIGSTLLMTLATGFFPKERINTGIGIYSMGQTAAQAIAPSIALSIVALKGYNYLYRYNVILMIGAFILSLFVKVDTTKNKDYQYSFKIKDIVAKEAFMPATLQFCNQIANAAVTAFLVLFAESIGIVNVGFYFTLRAIVLFGCRPIISYMADRIGTNKILIPCEILQILSFVALVFASNEFYFIISAVLMGISISGTQPALMSLCLNSVPENLRGKASNTNYLVTDLGGFIGSNIAGVVAGLVGYRNLFAIFIIPCVLCLFIYLTYIKRYTKQPAS